MYKIIKENPPKRLSIVNALRGLNVGKECLVFSLNMRPTIANTAIRLKKKGFVFTCKKDAEELKVWRLK